MNLVAFIIKTIAQLQQCSKGAETSTSVITLSCRQIRLKGS
jgi:hypothetical protein